MLPCIIFSCFFMSYNVAWIPRHLKQTLNLAKQEIHFSFHLSMEKLGLRNFHNRIESQSRFHNKFCLSKVSCFSNVAALLASQFLRKMISLCIDVLLVTLSYEKGRRGATYSILLLVLLRAMNFNWNWLSHPKQSSVWMHTN